MEDTAASCADNARKVLAALSETPLQQTHEDQQVSDKHLSEPFMLCCEGSVLAKSLQGARPNTERFAIQELSHLACWSPDPEEHESKAYSGAAVSALQPVGSNRSAKFRQERNRTTT